jgi:3-oxoacyl-[acyl-carrier protein] reductase
MTLELNGKRALVTGASGGIGRAIAESLHRRGAALAISGTRLEPLEQLARDLGGQTVVIPANLGDRAAIDELAAKAEAALGGIDILVNNAGVTRDQLFIRMSDDDWQTVLDVNLTAAFRLTRACLRGMMKRRFGRIISITSVVGAMGNAGQANYAASKAGLVAMSKSLAAEVASRNITVNCVAPGFITTAMTDKLSPEQRSRILGGIPVGRFGTGADVAECVAFLASEAAGFVTGQTLHVNGGMAMI